MKIIFFIENTQKGGVDTFCSLLINQWPNINDHIVLVCNESHPGRAILKRSIIRQCELVSHKIPLTWHISSKVPSYFPDIFTRAFRMFLRYALPIFQYASIYKIFKNIGGDKLLVVNGGYPGAETCRLANIVWFKMGREAGLHSFHGAIFPPKVGLRLYEKVIDRRMLESTKLFIGVSDFCTNSLIDRKSFDSLPFERKRRIYNGIIDNSSIDSKIDIRKKFMIGDNPICIMLGIYDIQKGHKFIFEAFKLVLKILPNAHLFTFGAGTDKELIVVRNTLEEIGIKDNVHISGFVLNGAALINQADVLLIGSQEYESFGFTAVEAMIRAKPVVSTNVGGLPEVIGIDGRCGHVVESKDVTGFADKVISLLEDKELRDSMGVSGRKRALEFFMADRMAQEYLDAIEE